MFLVVTHDPRTYGPMCEEPFNVGLQILDALSHKLPGTDPRHSYSVANFQKLVQRIQMSPHISSCTSGSSNIPTLLPTILFQRDFLREGSSHSPVDHPVPDTSSNILPWDTIDAHSGLWDENWFELLLQPAGAEPAAPARDMFPMP